MIRVNKGGEGNMGGGGLPSPSQIKLKVSIIPNCIVFMRKVYLKVLYSFDLDPRG